MGFLRKWAVVLLGLSAAMPATQLFGQGCYSYSGGGCSYRSCTPSRSVVIYQESPAKYRLERWKIEREDRLEREEKRAQASREWRRKYVEDERKWDFLKTDSGMQAVELKRRYKRAQTLLDEARDLEQEKKPSSALVYYQSILKAFSDLPQAADAQNRIRALSGG